MSYGFSVRKIAPDHYRLSWVIDFKYPNSRLRFPRVFSRDTDGVGATRFCRKHGVQIKEQKP